MNTMDLKTLKSVILNKVTKDIKVNHKKLLSHKEVRDKRDMERKNMGQIEDKEQDDRNKPN